jgi:hypothetical protein
MSMRLFAPCPCPPLGVGRYSNLFCVIPRPKAEESHSRRRESPRCTQRRAPSGHSE